ncbi:MAG: hypothetical protein ABI867_40495 [Kofleriaceae bacterium]
MTARNVFVFGLVAAATAAAETPKKSAYSGLGADSVSPEIAKYTAPALDDKVSRRIQAMLDVRGAGNGFVMDKGDRTLRQRIYYRVNEAGYAKLAVLDAKTLKPIALPKLPDADNINFGGVLESYAARDGTKIPMFVRRPASCPGACPVVVSFHGGPEGQALAGFSSSSQLFVDAGFVFVQERPRLDGL